MADSPENSNLAILLLGAATTVIVSLVGALFGIAKGNISQVKADYKEELGTMRAGIEQRLNEGRDDRLIMRQEFTAAIANATAAHNAMMITLAKLPTREEMTAAHERSQRETVAAVTTMLKTQGKMHE